METTRVSVWTKVICGVDEAGRGPWAGPVVAAAVILDRARPIHGLDDSKRLSAATRERLFDEIIAHAHVAVASVGCASIETLNIRGASLLAMRRAVEALPVTPELALVDGNAIPPGLRIAARGLVKGDQRSASIAAASIVAKVSRDRFMVRLAAACPGYGFETHKGYGTRAHQAALARLGPSIHHRRGFAPIRDALAAQKRVALTARPSQLGETRVRASSK
ncbi:MAG: ribonuclease HII [Pseudomonadota bacterium]